ncbi:MAG: helix-turn-helix domain-containing protein [Phycisphaerales bacterium]
MKLLTHDQLRAQLEPHLRAATILKTARAAGIAQQSLSAWVNGRDQLSTETLARVAAAVGFKLTHGYRLTRN